MDEIKLIKKGNYFFQGYLTLNYKDKQSLLYFARNELKEELKEKFSKNKIIDLKEYNEQIKIIDSDSVLNNYYDDLVSIIKSEFVINFHQKCAAQDLVIVTPIKPNFIGSWDDKNTITCTSCFCALPTSFDLKLPICWVMKYTLPREDTDMIFSELLISKKQYTVSTSYEVSDLSDITIDYKCHNFELHDLTIDVNRFCNHALLDHNDVYKLGLGTHKLINSNNLECTLTIKKIEEKKLYPLTNEVIKNINFFGCQTVQEATDYIVKLYSLIANVNKGTQKVFDTICDVNDFEFDKYTINFFKDTNYKTDEEAIDSMDDDAIALLKFHFISMFLVSTYNCDIEKYRKYIDEEYEFNILTTGEINTINYSDFENDRSMMYLLYDFCVENHLLERSVLWK